MAAAGLELCSGDLIASPFRPEDDAFPDGRGSAPIADLTTDFT
jgi:hypothetical protein